MKRNDTTMQYIIQQTAACCVLHNLCEMQEEEFEEDWGVEQDVDGHNINNPEGDEEDAEDVRDVLKGMLQRQRGL